LRVSSFRCGPLRGVTFAPQLRDAQALPVASSAGALLCHCFG
jgi:hypothetical protein